MYNINPELRTCTVLRILRNQYVQSKYVLTVQKAASSTTSFIWYYT